MSQKSCNAEGYGLLRHPMKLYLFCQHAERHGANGCGHHIGQPLPGLVKAPQNLHARHGGEQLCHIFAGGESAVDLAVGNPFFNNALEAAEQ